MPLLPSALPPKGEARRYVVNDFFNLIALLDLLGMTIRKDGYPHVLQASPFLYGGETATTTLNMLPFPLNFLYLSLAFCYPVCYNSRELSM